MYGSGIPEDDSSIIVVFLVVVIPLGILVSLVGHWFDTMTCQLIKDNSYGGNYNQVQGFNDNQSSSQELTEHQKELLKIPITAKKVSLFSISPGIIVLALKFVFGVDEIVRIHSFITLLSLQQSIRIVIILTCLLKANVANQLQLTAEERRQEMIEWERIHSFRYKENYKQARQALEQSLPGPSSQPSKARNNQQQASSHHQERRRQILDPALLEQIIIDGDNEVPGKKLSTKEQRGINQDLRLQNLEPISKDKAKLSSTDQGPKRSIKGPVMTKGHIPNDQCYIRQGIHQGRALTKSGPSHRTQHLDPCLLGQILEDGE